jgi:hypothetical protein
MGDPDDSAILLFIAQEKLIYQEITDKKKTI